MRSAPEFLEYVYDENQLYQILNMILEETEEKLEQRKPAFEYEQRITNGIEKKLYDAYT